MRLRHRKTASFISVFLMFGISMICAQPASRSNPDRYITPSGLKTVISFLASDDLKGRGLGTPGIEKAANYIAGEFRKSGLVNPAGLDNYLQPVRLVRETPAETGSIVVDTFSFQINKDFAILDGANTDQNKKTVFVNYGMKEDYDSVDARDKFVILLAGNENSGDVNNYFNLVAEKKKRAVQHGALGIIEITPVLPSTWGRIAGYFGKGRLKFESNSETGFIYTWINDLRGGITRWARSHPAAEINIKISGYSEHEIPAWNVAGILEGNDPVLKDQYIVASAHYDHLGVGEAVEGDSIYNGARDNAIGTASVIMSAEFLKAAGIRRSVLFLAFTGEEEGMLGSAWYAGHPLVPLNQTVFNLNTDGAGYDDTTLVTLIDPGRTDADSLLAKASNRSGLKMGGDPAPEERFYERSDNINFAMRGIPALNISPGASSMSEEIMKYYHQPQDEAGNLNYNYLAKYLKAYCYSLKYLADKEKAPFWMTGDPNEKVGIALYGKRP